LGVAFTDAHRQYLHKWIAEQVLAEFVAEQSPLYQRRFAAIVRPATAESVGKRRRQVANASPQLGKAGLPGSKF